MPHIDIKLFPGRSDEMKKAAALKIVEAAAAELAAPFTRSTPAAQDPPAFFHRRYPDMLPGSWRSRSPSRCPSWGSSAIPLATRRQPDECIHNLPETIH